MPEYPKAKHGNAIGLNIMPDRFSFRKTGTSKDWFQDFDIMYDTISDIHIEKRTISTAEMLLGGGNDYRYYNLRTGSKVQGVSGYTLPKRDFKTDSEESRMSC